MYSYYYSGIQIIVDFENVDLASIDFSDFSITCSTIFIPKCVMNSILGGHKI